MTQISPRNSGSNANRKTTVRFLMACSGILWVVIILIFVYLSNVHPPHTPSLSIATSSSYASSLGHPKSSFRSVTTTKTQLTRHTSGDAPKDRSNTENNSNNNFRNSNLFDWDDLQISQNVPGMCGADKCFWRSASDPESVGYLVASAGYNYQPMKRAYEFAVDVLEGKCHSKHLYLEAPKRVRVTPSFVRKLNSLTHNDHAKFLDDMESPRNGAKPRNDRKIFEEDEHSVVVQKVRVAPKPNLMFGYMARKWDMLVEKDVPRFRSELQAKGISFRHLEDTLESERKGIECAMQYSNTYWFDLQGLIDLEGNYFHIDVDSQFWVEISEHETEKKYVRTVTQIQAYRGRHTLIGKFNEMIQRLVDPPPDGVGELSAREEKWEGRKNTGDDDESESEEDDSYD